MDKISIKVVTNAILSRCDSEEKIQELLSCLHTVNWTELLVAKDYESHLRPCGICNEPKDMRTFSYVLDWNLAGIKYVSTCPECQQKTTLTISCTVCDTTYKTLSLPSTDFVCTHCRPIHELVTEHNARARQLNLPATLTARQWTETLKHFNQRCAYCNGPYECLEHFLPLSLEGGNTSDNCVPACTSCNTKKRNRHPSKIDKIFRQANLKCIYDWLAQQSL